MPTHPLDELVSFAKHHGAATNPPLADFVAAYFEAADPDELQARGAATLYAMASTHWRLLAVPRAPQQARIRVFNPTLAEDGFVSEHTVIQIVHDDMPFLVDSVTMAVNRCGYTAHWVVHPLLAVQRRADGTPEASTRAAAAPPGTALESVMLVECDRMVAQSAREALAAELERVLADVRAAVQDWQAMLERLHTVAAAAEAGGPASASRQEGVAFLRWLEDRHFTFLGARNYDLVRTADGVQLQAVADSGLGLLRGPAHTPTAVLPPDAVAVLESDQLVLVTKAMTRSTVHRPAWLDYVAVKRFDAGGVVVGEARFLGLYTASAYTAQVADIPQVRLHVSQVMARAQVVAESHAAKSLQAILEAYPRDELFQIDTATLGAHAMGILRLQERQRTRVFLRRDPFGRYTSALVFVPRERFNTDLRVRIGAVLTEMLDGHSIEFTPMLTDSPMARIHYLVRAATQAPQDVDLAELERRVARLTQRWEDDCTDALLRAHGEGQGLALAHRFCPAFPTAYREDFAPAVAAEDAELLASLGATTPMTVRLYRALDATEGNLRFKIYSATKVALSDSLPILEHMGARVLDEHPYRIGSNGNALWIHDLGLQLPANPADAPGTLPDLGAIKERFEALFTQAWQGLVESDALNKLVLCTTLDARAIAVLRAYTRYFKQLALPYSQAYLHATLLKNARLAQAIHALFVQRLDPALNEGREAQVQPQMQQLEAGLLAVASLDEDRILRHFVAAVQATLRTNAWQTAADGGPKPVLSLKLNPRALACVPEPRPLFEIWVYAPRVEGVHLRGGKVARGGLRWSERPEDFRTEVLGLVKAQQVKNTVIVPVGSKGGFVLKKAPPPSAREATMTEGIACYKLFLCGLLDLTDNIVQGAVVPPARTVRHDGDDPYLVVAADKGTATFSDTANAVSAQYGFWLGDAFASGGSQGYDHKKMGITARGAWESAKRHFRALGRDIQTQPFTVTGIGDMSGDVFGNGMLLSPHIQLVLAFDHRHIFIDPAPDCARSFAERARLFALPRSSWDDFDKSVISEGGGVFARSAKSIRLSPQARAVVGTDVEEWAPTDLLKAILMAPVDLLYNGGIGTYVKGSAQTHAQVGDKAGDAFRVDGAQLRCKVLVEGGNLGLTQPGRIEYAQNGGLVYTDAIDNSAGVDCSDHEVNIKILLDQLVQAGDLTSKQRNALLVSMTDEVARLVLQDNYYQPQALDIAGHRPLYLLDGQQRLMQWQEGGKRLNRALEYLPDDAEIARRRARGEGLTAPENAVLLAYAKMQVFDELLASNLPDDPYFARALTAYFPAVLTERFGTAIAAHPLKREIIATVITNTTLNRTGATFVNFIATETLASTADVVRAFTLARAIFDLEPLWDQIDALDGVVPSALQLDLLWHLIAMAKRAARSMLRLRANGADLPSLVARYQPAARALRAHLEAWLPAATRSEWQAAADTLVRAGVAPPLAENLTALEYTFAVLDLADLAQQTNTALQETAQTYFAVDALLALSAWRTQINRLPTDTLWQTQARASARDDVYSTASQITHSLLARQINPETWSAQHRSTIDRLHRMLSTLATQAADLAPVSVALRELRHLA
ncbi:MAG: NAD-glutamate dehydrogenase [Burkholderiales bacterium]|nr:NAD-glutamate dehydrogenase [Burkholderiales bacterium]